MNNNINNGTNSTEEKDNNINIRNGIIKVLNLIHDKLNKYTEIIANAIENKIAKVFNYTKDEEELNKLFKKIFSEENLSEEEVKIIESQPRRNFEKLFKKIEESENGDSEIYKKIRNLPKKALIKILKEIIEEIKRLKDFQNTLSESEEMQNRIDKLSNTITGSLIEKMLSGKLDEKDKEYKQYLEGEESNFFYSKLIEKLIEKIFLEENLNEETKNVLDLILKSKDKKENFYSKLIEKLVEKIFNGEILNEKTKKQVNLILESEEELQQRLSNYIKTKYFSGEISKENFENHKKELEEYLIKENISDIEKYINDIEKNGNNGTKS